MTFVPNDAPEPTDKKPGDSYVQSFARGLAVVNAFNAARPAQTLSEVAQASARAKGGERYDRFLEALGRRLANGPRLRQEVPEDCR